jgi:hypothetical protein
VSLFAQKGEEPPLELPLSGFEPGVTEFSGELQLRVLDALQVAPGQKLRLWAQAADNQPGQPNVTRGDPLELKVLSVPDYLAELAGRELELRREFERLFSEQRGLSDALERLLPNLAPDGPPAASAGQQLAGLARRQEAHGQRSLGLQQSFADILAEMAINAVERRGDERRIGEKIIAPLSDLGERRMPGAASTLARLRRQADAGGLRQAPDEQADIIRAMQAILANMLEWEGYREVVALLTDIIEEQNQVRTATGQALGGELDAILGLDEPAPASSPTPEPP